MLHDFRVWRLMDDGSSCLVMGCVVDEKMVFVAQPCPAWKSTRISTRVATRVTCKAGRCCPSQRTSTSRYQRATNSCFARACVMLPLPGPAPSRPAHLFRAWWSCLSLANSSHKAEGPPSLVNARHCSSQKLQLAKAQEPSMPESQERRETSLVRKARTARKKSHP